MWRKTCAPGVRAVRSLRNRLLERRGDRVLHAAARPGCGREWSSEAVRSEEDVKLKRQYLHESSLFVTRPFCNTRMDFGGSGGKEQVPRKVAELVLARPRYKNAVSTQTVSELRRHVQTLQSGVGDDDVRVVLVRSDVAGVFSAGADLKERASLPEQLQLEFTNAFRDVLQELSELPMPTVAAVDGYALGGGAEIALSCDIRIASASAVIGFPECSRGVLPGAGGCARLPHVLSPSRAKLLIFGGQPIDGREAERCGLVDCVVDSSEMLLTEARKLCSRIAENSPSAVQLAKKCLSAVERVDVGEALGLEKSFYSQTLNTKDRQEGIAAFNEKRKPVFTGQ
uniref:Enoyl-CoA hydratase n=1 Tax=Erythrolobus australicus TaxID=1077150 RepID=A0A7S1TLR8_9RHOD|mmetsp:Transcript_3557/g.9878  ORF Transcript_3557/g.9878 Transcript_3557/m.9878 type:complete len:341 (+) Transcript_3557:58-1080(+)